MRFYALYIQHNLIKYRNITFPVCVPNTEAVWMPFGYIGGFNLPHGKVELMRRIKWHLVIIEKVGTPLALMEVLTLTVIKNK